MGSRNAIFLGFAAGILVTMIAAAVFLSEPYRYQGSLIETPNPAFDFTLEDQHGSTFRLSDQKGKVALLFFGYTNCPDVCPVTLSEYGKIFDKLGGDASQVVFLFVTVDPERDSLERIARYLSNFHPAIVGLTGPLEDLEVAWKQYGIFVQKQERGSAGGYLVDHTARLYVVDKDGKLRITFPFGFSLDSIAADVSHLLKE